MYNFDGVKRLNVSDEGFVFDPQTGRSFKVNQTAKDTMHALLEEKNLDDITALLTKSYGLTQHQASRDIYDFIDKLMAYGLIRHE